MRGRNSSEQMRIAQQPEIRPPAHLKRLILCFDGTWNTPEGQTNVSRMYAESVDQHAGCDDQLKFYDAGRHQRRQ